MQKKARDSGAQRSLSVGCKTEKDKQESRASNTDCVVITYKPADWVSSVRGEPRPQQGAGRGGRGRELKDTNRRKASRGREAP